MSATFYHINTTLAATGHTHQSDYWPGGNGEQYAGYVTSMDQYCADLRRSLTASNFALYVVTSNGQAKLISDDGDLKDAVDSLPDRAVLSITAIESSSGSRRNRRRRRARNTADDEDWNARHQTGRKWYDEVYSTDEEDGHDYNDTVSDDESVEENVGYHAAPLRVVTAGSKVNAILRRFDVHTPTVNSTPQADEAQCYHCDATEWDGVVRYCYAANTDYSLCSGCYKQLPKWQKKDWEKAAEEEPTTTATSVRDNDAPEYPLYREDEPTVRDSVRQLQYILTRIGLMPLSATDQVVGSYQSNTEDAVRQFRKRYAIRGGDMSVYNKATAKKLGEVVRHMRAQGHKHM